MENENANTGSIQTHQQQVEAMQKLMDTQLQMMQLQIQQQQLQQQTAAQANITATPVTSTVKNVKVPEGQLDMNPNEFRTFSKDCRDYKKLTNYSDEQIVLQIRMNMDADLKRSVDVNFKEEWDSYTVEEAMKAVGKLLKSKNTPVVYRREFDGMMQNEGEDFKTFITKLKACAADCNFVCPHDENHCLMEYHLINRIRSGVFDQTLQQELLQKSETLNTLQLITSYCKKFESAKLDQEKLVGRNASALATVHTDQISEEEIIAAVPFYKKHKKQGAKKNKCRNCGHDWPHPGGRENCPANGHICKKCGKPNHFEAVCKTNSDNISKPQGKEISAIISAILRVSGLSKRKKRSLPRLQVTTQTTSNGKKISTDVVADTGAEVNAAGREHLKHLGLQVKDLTPPNLDLQHAGGSALKIIGSYPLYITHNNQTILEDVYFAEGVGNIYLSCDSCKGISIIHQDFPNVNVSEPSKLNSNMIKSGTNQSTSASKSLPSQPASVSISLPSRPDELPFTETEENIPNLERWLLEAFSTTTFNNRDPMPHMGEPMRIHLKEDAIPFATHTPIPTPIHMRKKTEEELKKNVRDKIMKKVEVGEANEWCARMLPVLKKDGNIRLTVDYQKLNEQFDRETYHTPRPFDVVSSVPPHTFKTVLDAHSGYHQVILEEGSVKLTTFITDIGGRYQSLRAPQGFKG